jgi:hypothetical protein
MKIEGLRKFDHRNPNGYFNDLPPQARMAAWRWLAKFRQRWGRNMTPWRFAILVGQAKRLALKPPTSEWGRSMLAKRGGHAVQRKYKAEGRHPTKIATRNRLLIQASLKRREAELNRRRELGLPPPARVKYLPID